MKCIHCSDGHMAEKTYTGTIEIDGVEREVSGLKHNECDSCGGQSVNRDQVRSNRCAITEAFEDAQGK